MIQNIPPSDTTDMDCAFSRNHEQFSLTQILEPYYINLNWGSAVTFHINKDSHEGREVDFVNH
jgi:hypothetical protein